MKKLLSVITLAATMFTATSAFAADSIEDTIVEGVKSFETTIDVSGCDATVDEVMDTFASIFNTNPVMTNLDGNIQCAYKGDKATYITVSYIQTTGTSAANEQNEADKVLESIVNTAKSKGSKVEEAKYVHDYLIDNSEYDYTYKATTLYDLLVTGKGTCNSYSMAYKAAMDKLGIECVIVVNDSHAWNQINIDGKWYNIDVTWDENYTLNGTPDTTFFMKSDDFFKATEHNSWNSKNKCEADY